MSLPLGDFSRPILGLFSGDMKTWPRPVNACNCSALCMLNQNTLRHTSIIKKKRNNTALYLGENETTGIQITGLIIGSPEPLEGSVAAFCHPVITGQIKETNHHFFFLDGSSSSNLVFYAQSFLDGLENINTEQ